MPHKQYSVKSPQHWRKKTTHQITNQTKGVAFLIKKITKKLWSRNLLSKLIISGIVAVLALVVFAFMAAAWYSRDLPTPGELIDRPVPVSTKIYDRTGQTALFEFYSDEKRTPVKLGELPQYVKWATIVVEDRSFYSHHGFDLKGFLRAAILNLLGRGRPGGSTITQQLIKNAVLTSEKTLTRKIKELVLAWQIENKFTKDQILELYLNEIPYGSVSYGIESASQTFFGKSAKDLTIAQAAVLAALPQAPSRYSPHGPNRDLLLGRQQFIINNLQQQGYITAAEASAALAEPILFREFSSGPIQAPHFVFYVKELLSQKYGEFTVEQGGLKVVTTLDLFKQNIAEKIISERGAANAANYDAANAALVALNPKSGEILTMVGSRDFFNEDIDGEVNVALRPRQPGSSFKPIVYAAAFEAGLSPDTMLFDLNTIFKTEIGQDYEPKNYDLKQNGPVSIRQALGSSLNTPAVKTIYLIGVDRVLDLAEKLGYSTLRDRSRFGLSLVLGGAEIKLLEHAAAYGTLARDGLYQSPIAILRVEDKNGNILEDVKPEQKKPLAALDPQVVRQINSILVDNGARLLTFQPNNYLYFPNRPVAAKTGTTNDFRDAWTVGYTPSLVAGVWVGNNDNRPMRGAAAGGTLAAPIWREFMQQVLGDTPVEVFKEPETRSLPNKPMLNGQVSFTNRVKIDQATGLMATDYTPQKNIIEKVYAQVHNILHYINRKNLLGPIPENPWTDPNYTSWELPVEEWAKAQGFESVAPPDKFDDIHKVQDQPTLTVNDWPSVIVEPIFEVKVSGRIPRGARLLEIYLDNNLIKTEILSEQIEIDSHAISVTVPTQFANGIHLLKVVIYDDLNNDAEVGQNFTLQLPNRSSRQNILEFSNLANNSIISRDGFPLEVGVHLESVASINKIDFYWLSKTDNSSVLITSRAKPVEDFVVTISLPPPIAGNYSLYTIIQDQKNNLELDSKVDIELK